NVSARTSERGGKPDLRRGEMDESSHADPEGRDEAGEPALVDAPRDDVEHSGARNRGERQGRRRENRECAEVGHAVSLPKWTLSRTTSSSRGRTTIFPRRS